MYQNEFERHLKYLKKRYSVIHPRELGELIEKKKKVPKGTILITIDDGFQNTLDYALPVAESLDVPFLSFIATKHLNEGEWLWCSKYNAYRLNGQNSKALKQFETEYPSLSIEKIEQLVDEMNGSLQSIKDPLQKLMFDGMSATQLAEASRSSVLVVGGHTVNHPRLTNESNEVVSWELEENKKTLERITNQPIQFFAYPEGVVNEQVACQVRKAGYLAAFSIDPPPPMWPRELEEFHIPRKGIFRSGQLYLRLKCMNISNPMKWSFSHA